MSKKEIIKHLHEALNFVDITFPYRYVFVEAIEALSQPSPPSDIDKAAEEYEHNLGYYECMNQWPGIAFKAGAQWAKEQMKPIRVVAEDAWGLSDGRVFAGKLRIVDGGCGDAIVVPGFNEEFTLYKEAKK